MRSHYCGQVTEDALGQARVCDEGRRIPRTTRLIQDEDLLAELLLRRVDQLTNRGAPAPAQVQSAAE